MKNPGVISLLLLTGIAVMSVGVLGSQQPEIRMTPVTPEQLRSFDGEKLYQNLCSDCHGPTGAGNGPVAGHLDPRPANLTLLSREHGGKYPSTAVLTTISGRYSSSEMSPAMPRWEEILRHTLGDPMLARQKLHILNRHVKSLQEDS